MSGQRHIPAVSSDLLSPIEKEQSGQDTTYLGNITAVGAISGLVVVLSRIAVEATAHPPGIALWVNTVAVGICIPHTACRGKPTRLNRSLIMLFALVSNFR